MRDWTSIEDTFGQGPVDQPIESPVERHVFFHYSRMVYVEFMTAGDVGVLTCAEENGRVGQTKFDTGELDTLRDQCKALGFLQIGPWHHDETTGIVRTYVNTAERAEFRVIGTTLHIESERAEFDARADAEAAAEKWIGELRQAGYYLRRMRTSGGSGNPPRVEPPTIPELKPIAAPTTPHEAVDRAVERLTELHRLFPTTNMVMELTTAEDHARLEHFPELDENSWQWQRLGRWLDAAELEENPASSFDYLIERYGTLSWFLAGDWALPREVATHRSNGHAGPTTPLEILPAETYPLLEDLANYENEPDYLKLKLFMSDEECNGWAFDTRFESNGEFLIVWFEGHDGPALDGSESDEIQPFGYWLWERVEELTEQLLPWLALTSPPQVAAEGSE